MVKVENGNYSQVRFLEGDSGLKELYDSNLLRQWNHLMQCSSVYSVFQSPDFVLPWLEENKKEYSPLILLMYLNGSLIGLLPLARKIDIKSGKLSKHLVGSGHFYALYQTWLLVEGYEDIFWEKGLLGLINHIPGCEINLKSLPNLESFKKMASNNKVFKYSVIEKYHNPILGFKLDDYQKIINKRHFKAKFNRVNKSGELLFEHLNSLERLQLALNHVEVFHNLRQGAAFNKIPFPLNKEEINIFMEWFKMGILHATALWLDGELIGAIIMIKDGDHTVHLAGLITYSPFHSKYSPGLVHLYLLVLRLKEEGINYLKLSPGNDSYKERFSNESEELFELLISRNRLSLLKRKFRIPIRNLLLRKGIRPMDISVWIDKKRASIKNRWFKLRIGNIHKEVDWIHFLGKFEKFNENKILGEIELRVMDISQLLLVDDYTFEICRWEFLNDALKRLEENQIFYTITKNNRLIFCVWDEKPEKLSGMNYDLKISYNPKNTFAALDIDFKQLEI
ncbi:GNAT family N-acetyltransferase [Cognataquiflexum rubidum]|uniref:GNAT family N-acetyltransferase n=1 Tax=Cognataquiflexum rubidum TaxID=2922273 RepID=UPI001F148AF0|nr:GNAT family N-acetyltransferase [Cognataquiflexum rubidum]MCH6236771.1 GNAT family N-acetyltransferase [Cognataquiflexum rubidum]